MILSVRYFVPASVAGAVSDSLILEPECGDEEGLSNEI